MKNTHIFLILILTTAFACSEETDVKPVLPSSDVKKISELLVGEWSVSEFDYLPIDAQNLAIQTFKSNDANLCDKITNMFRSDNVVSKYVINYTNHELKVQKHYFCDSQIDEVTWLVELNLDDQNPNLNWMTQKNFLIVEKTKNGNTTNVYKNLFFNLDSPSASDALYYQLWLNVSYSSVEPWIANFNLRFTKTI